MKFCDKLTKLRKENNLSQEQLAEKLGMSRQAISKWESGNSYPDMSTMIRICKILNCSIEDLLDDAALGNKVNNNDKFSINKWLNDFLNFITKTYNMFLSMTFKEKIKCILELIIVGISVFLAFYGIGSLLLNLFVDIFGELSSSYIYFLLFRIGKLAYSICAFILGIMIFLHIFKIRYLDYFVTIEDNNVNEKQIEKDIEKKYNPIDKKERIIIRDPKHSTYSFFNGLSKIISSILKLLLSFLLIPLVLSFIAFIVIGTISLFWLRYGSIFAGIFIGVIGIILINYDLLEIIIKLPFNKAVNFKKSFIFFIVGLVLSGVGMGFSISKFLSLNSTSMNLMYNSKTLSIKAKDNLLLENINNTDNIIIDNNEKNILIEVDYLKEIEIYLSDFINFDYNNKAYNEYYIDYRINILDMLNNFLNDLKKDTLRNYDDVDFYKVKSITLSQENYEKIINNKNELNKDIYDYCDCE